MTSQASTSASAAASTSGTARTRTPSRFYKTLQTTLQDGHARPGCIFVQATTTTDQMDALWDVRELCRRSNAATPPSYGEVHPNLLGTRVIDVRREIDEAFEDPLASTSASASTSIASTVKIWPDEDEADDDGAAATSPPPTPRILVVPSAHLLRATHSPQIWSQFLAPSRRYTVVLISSIPLDRWRTAEGVENTSSGRPVVRVPFRTGAVDAQKQRSDLQAVLQSELAAAIDDDNKAGADDVDAAASAGSSSSHPHTHAFLPHFVTFVAAALTAEVSPTDGREIAFLARAIWRALQQILVHDGDDVELDSKYAHPQRLLASLRPLVRSALTHVHTRRTSVDEWIKQHVESGAQTSLSSSPSSSLLPHPSPSLPALPSLLLLSSFLASHLAPKSDSRFFLRDEATLPNFTRPTKKRRRKAKSSQGQQQDEASSSSASSSSLLLGPKPFTYQRMLYIFQNLCVEFGVAITHSVQGAVLSKRRGEKAPPPSLSETSLASTTVHRHLQKLIDRGYITVVSPPFSFSTTSQDNAALAPVPLRLEHLNQITMRCNSLKDEVRELVLGGGGEVGEEGMERKQWWARVEECGL